MGVNRNALLTVMIYLVFFVFAFLVSIDIEADEFLLEEETYATFITAPFSVLISLAVSLVGIEFIESNTWAYVIWFVSAALNSIAIYVFSGKVYDVLGSKPISTTAANS